MFQIVGGCHIVRSIRHADQSVSQGGPIKPLNTDSECNSVELTRHERRIANTLIHEARIFHRCDSPDGQALENGIRSIEIRLEEAVIDGCEFGGVH
jgi:hypothetical protein